MSDFSNHYIQEFSSQGSLIKTFALGTYPGQLALDSSGNVYDDDATGAILEFTPNGSESTFYNSTTNDYVM